MVDYVDNVIKEISEKDIKFVRLQFVDIHGTPKNISVSLGNNKKEIEDLMRDGMLFDGSSVAGFVEIHESDLVLKPDPRTFSSLPWRPEEFGVGRFICDIYTPEGKPFAGDPRSALKESLSKLNNEGYKYHIGPEPEFFIVDQDKHGNYIPQDMGGYFDVEPIDKGPNFRRQLVNDLEKLGFELEGSHHEVAPGQNEIAFKFDNALKTADAVITFKQAIKAIVAKMASKEGEKYMATFMPKPFFGENGSGMHCHQSLFKDGRNLFADDNTKTGLSKEAMYFMGGLLKHSAALSAIVAPIVNSYKRLVPGYEAPVYKAYGIKNRSALIRIPAAGGQATRIEYRCPDPSCNPYLAFAAMLEAGLDGIKNKIDPGEPTQVNIYKMSDDELKKRGIELIPSSLWEAYHAFKTNDVIKGALGDHISKKFLELKYAEWDEYRIRVFNYEQNKYINI